MCCHQGRKWFWYMWSRFEGHLSTITCPYMGNLINNYHFVPWIGKLDIFFGKCQNPNHMSDPLSPHPHGLTSWCINSVNLLVGYSVSLCNFVSGVLGGISWTFPPPSPHFESPSWTKYTMSLHWWIQERRIDEGTLKVGAVEWRPLTGCV